MFKKSIILSLLACFLAVTGFASAKGTSGAQFLKVVASPRIAAMGQTFAAVSDDVNSITYNPGGLASLNKKEITLVQNAWIQDIANQYLAVGVPIEKLGIIGLGVNMLSVKDIEKMDSSQNSLGTYNSNDMAITLAYATKMNNKLNLGLNVKMVNCKIDDETASAYGADIGAIYKASPKLDFGISVQNIGTELKFIEEGDPLPMTVRLGGAYKAMDQLLIGLDVHYPNDADLAVSLGAEYKLKAGDKLIFPIRAGYKSGYETEEMSGLGTGLGVLYDNLLSIDFAWTPMGILGDSMKLGIGFRF